jgi:hypothetical protein
VRRWEVGGFYGLPTVELDAGAGTPWLPADARLLGTGRQALRALLSHGAQEHGWDTVLVPSYYCDDVTQSIRRELPTREYPATPGGTVELPSPGPTQVVLAMATFGIPPTGLDDVPGDRLVVDVSHDPLAPWIGTLPDCWVTASLRKTLPLPDGGVVWHTGAERLPEPGVIPPAHARATARMLTAMLMRQEYLDGCDLPKDEFRGHHAEAEAGYDDDRPGAISAYSRALLPLLPVHDMRAARLRNIDALRRSLTPTPRMAHLASTFGGILLFETPSLREAVRSALIRNDVYPAVIWPKPGPFGGEPDRDFSDRMLKVYADHRYSEADMRRVADLIDAAVADA